MFSKDNPVVCDGPLYEFILKPCTVQLTSKSHDTVFWYFDGLPEIVCKDVSRIGNHDNNSFIVPGECCKFKGNGNIAVQQCCSCFYIQVSG